ncbi:MAG: hypothetical protein ABS87_13830 [Sphingomonas sp. SCN 67-18]|nr:response regulator transcription factor [Sphingomonas sp. SCN 67-18]ODU19545.1 MAG: hypothetical protein ABS87_13830 [Sphingomonas sp. SCN 67-18]
MKALLIEDNPELRGMIAAHLATRGLAVDAFATGEEARAALALSTYDILLLDLGLPDGDGLELITEITSRPNLHLPIIVITARDALSSRLDGLNAGADDYLVKPFDLLELHARIQAILRRPSERQSGILACGDVTFDMGERDGFVGGRAMRLPRREAAMMEELLRAAGRTVIRDVLEERLYAFNEPVTPNAIEAVVSRLRKKMELLGSTIRIETKRGIGYRISDDPGVTP